MYTVGIDIGASSVKLVALTDAEELAWRESRLHRGAALACLRDMLAVLASKLPEGECAGWAAAGSGAAALRGIDPACLMLEEVPAVCQGAQLLAPEARSVIEIGGQSALFVTGVGSGQVPQFAMNESCAAGTGSFFEDQMERLGLALEEYSDLVEGAVSAPRISGRCAVFAKTDIIHHQQEGASVQDILLGLCFAMVKSYKATIVRGLPVARPVALSGGVLANRGVVRAVREVFELGEGELLHAPDHLFFQAAGAAREARAQGGRTLSGKDGCRPLAIGDLAVRLAEHTVVDDLPRLRALPSVPVEARPGFRLRPRPWSASTGEPVDCALGIDVGSTSTNLVLLDARGALLDAQYLRTRGDARRAVREGLGSLAKRLGSAVRVTAVGVTGSGRSMIGKMVGADAVRDEITAQARAAVAADARVDTVFEIGGQDSKYVSLKDGRVADFQMNKICAAGTGSFVEEQAARLGIELADYGPLALSSKAPIDLGERCTVFVETAINAALAKGASTADVAAGLCLSVVRNYLHRVVGTKPVGVHVVLQGGVAYNPGIVAAFKAHLGDALSVSPWFAVSGAVGAALLAQEAGAEATAFRGFDLTRASQASRAVDRASVEENRRFFRKVDELFLEGYDARIDPSKQTVGIPRCLMLHKLFPLANAFFKQLGYNVLLSDATDEETVRLSQQTAQGETCYPVKLVHGHLEQLARRGVDYVFMPAVRTIRHVSSKVAHNYACPYMQSAPMLAAKELDFEGRGILLLSPVLDMDFGQQAVAEALLGVGAQLGKEPRETARAMLAGGFAVQEFTRKTEELGEQLLGSLGPDERVLVLITRNYGIVDPALNMGIPDALLDRGRKVITVSHLHAHDVDVSQDHPGLYWPFGQHIVSGAKLVRRDPRLFAVYLTNHGCGPDTMVSHLFREEMGDKPYLHIETDEHSSQVGVVTRIEAFLNAIDHYEPRDERALPLAGRPYEAPHATLDAQRVVALPSFGAWGPLVGGWLEGRGLRVELLEPDDAAVAAGRARSASKEYLSFTALLGMSLRAAAKASAERAGASGLQLLLPSTEGAEADGQYDRVIRAVLDEEGAADAKLVAPILDQLPWSMPDPEGFFLHLLAGDVAYAADQDDRQEVLDGFLRDGVTFERVCAAARRAGDAAEGGSRRARKTLALVGEWPLVYADQLTGGRWEGLERAGYRLVRMPLSEYLWFLWRDARQPDELLAAFAAQMAEVHRSLGCASPFYASLDDLRIAADEALGGYRGANGRYRAAKARLAAREADGVIAVSSMYENTGIVLKLLDDADDLAAPVLHVSFDGALDQGIDERLRSFLYYV